jgi:hypothetical protein
MRQSGFCSPDNTKNYDGRRVKIWNDKSGELLFTLRMFTARGCKKTAFGGIYLVGKPFTEGRTVPSMGVVDFEIRAAEEANEIGESHGNASLRRG